MENRSDNEDCNQSNQESFDYAVLDVEAKIVVQNHACEIKKMLRRTTQDIIEIGKKLIEVKDYVGHGRFSSWLLAEFSWKERTARNFMRVAEVFKSANFADLFIANSALYLLAAASTPESARQEVLKLAKMGEPISFSRAKSIISQHQKVKEVRNCTDNGALHVNKYEVISGKAKSAVSGEASNENLTELQSIAVLTVVINEDILEGKKASAENLRSMEPLFIKISDEYKMLIKHVDCLEEYEVTALIRAIAKHRSLEEILEKIKQQSIL